MFPRINSTTIEEPDLPAKIFYNKSESPTPKLNYHLTSHIHKSLSGFHYSSDKCQSTILRVRFSHRHLYIYRYHPKARVFVTDRRSPIQSIILIVNHLVARLFHRCGFKCMGGFWRNMCASMHMDTETYTVSYRWTRWEWEEGVKFIGRGRKRGTTAGPIRLIPRRRPKPKEGNKEE